MRKIEYGKLAENFDCRLVVCSSGKFSGFKATDAFAANDRSVGASAALAPHTAIAAGRCYADTVGGVLGCVGKAQVCSAIIKTIAIDVIDNNTFRRGQNLAVEPKLATSPRARRKATDMRCSTPVTIAEGKPEMPLSDANIALINEREATARQRNFPNAVAIQKRIALYRMANAEVGALKVQFIAVEVKNSTVAVMAKDASRETYCAPRSVSDFITRNST